MIDQSQNLFDTNGMLTTTKNAAKPRTTASPLRSAMKLTKDLEFAAANQQMEGFPGHISEAVAGHEPNMEEIAEDAKRFGAQVPTEENLRQPPVFQNWKTPDRRT